MGISVNAGINNGAGITPGAGIYQATGISKTAASSPAPSGPDYLFVDGALGAWYQYTPLSKLKQDSSGTVAVANPGDVIGYWNGWNPSPEQMIQTTTANKPTYDGSSVYYDAPDTASTKGLSCTVSIPDTSSYYFVYAARIIPVSAGELRIGAFQFDNETYHSGSGIAPQFGFVMQSAGTIRGYCEGNGRTHGTGWTVGTPVAVAVIGNGDFGSTAVYVNGSSLNLFTAGRQSLTRFGIGAYSGQWQVQKAVMLHSRTTAPSAQDITDLFTWLGTAP